MEAKNLFVTVFYAVWDPFTHQLTYANGGHNPPLLIRANGEIELLHNTGVILGILPEVEIHQRTITLHPNDTLLCYTDGITEALDPSGAMYGMSGIETALRACSGEPGCVCESIRTTLQAHEAGRRPSDDQTIVALKSV